MSVRKRNEYLEDGGSEEESGNGYDSDAAEESRGALTGRASKRLKTEDVESDDESFHIFGDEEADNAHAIQDGKSTRRAAATGVERFMLGSDFEEDEQDAPELEDDAPTTITPTKPKSKTPKSVAAAEKATRKSGVVYLSRVPPFMKPQTLRHFLTAHAPRGLGRIFLTPEDHTLHLQRVKRGGNKKKSFTDGWVEFTSKTEAKIAAETLNGNIIGGKKGNFYHDDLWNMKYLKGFKWSHLTEQISNENAERAARLREEVRRTKKENKAFLEDVERGKMLEGIQSKKKARRKVGEEATVTEVRRGRDFKQRKVQRKKDREGGVRQSADLQRVLGKIF